MNLVEENKEKRKNASLTIAEWFGFFLLPINMSLRYISKRDFNDDQENRFATYGFDKKMKQAGIARLLGILFYIVAMIILFAKF
ncbi:hypothetical protein JBL43_08770 [Aureibaculum sp. A20]|uniref:Uncharacterized protein n=1 Tax=Aureibaculum flavum TaxID=2795986 RepID=A0ABS0WQR4_9FLAO|nr:hypothetical protein [Aureibaculum flavum]MBJ2174329.1 hypothetical protein [Aureibaculum flavum]